jgi:hypothetical protein
MAEYSPEDYALATQLNARLAVSPDPALIGQAKQVAQKLIDHVRGSVDDFDAFVAKVKRGEEYSLTESLQVTKGDKALRVLYLRAADLLENVAEAEARARRRG